MSELYICTGASLCNLNICGHQKPHEYKGPDALYTSKCYELCPKHKLSLRHTCKKVKKDNWDE